MKDKSFLAGYSFKKFFAHRVNGGLLLIIVCIVAIFIANSGCGEAYHSLWQHKFVLKIGDYNLLAHHGEPLTLMQFINDALMAVFFFSVGLEIKREVLIGELSSIRKSLLPIIAAVGGMVLPVVIFYAFTAGRPESVGMAIPMATDIAFSLGILSLFGDRVPASLKIFLAAFAVVDDIGGILVIALFYSSGLSLMFLLFAFFILVILIIANKKGVTNKAFYIICGIVIWYLFLQSGIHSSIAGVVVAFTIPTYPKINVQSYLESMRYSLSHFPYKEEDVILSNDQFDELRRINDISNKVISPLQALEAKLHGIVNYFIIPLFAFANAGITFGDTGEGMSILTLAVMAGLVLGKSLGIFVMTYFTIKTGISPKPNGMNWKNLFGVSMLGGIGFTVSLFIANLSFDTPETFVMLEQAKMGVLFGTMIAAVLGCVILNFVLPKKKQY